MSTPQEQAKAHADFLLSTGMAYEITPHTIAYRAFLDGFAAGAANNPDTKRLDLLDQIPSGFGWNVDLAGIRLTLSRKDSDLDMYDSIRSAIDAATGSNRS